MGYDVRACLFTNLADLLDEQPPYICNRAQPDGGMYMDAPTPTSASLMEPDYMGSFLALMSRPDVGEIDGAGFHGVISCLDVTTIYNAARGGMKSRRCRCLTIPNHKFERA